MFPWESCYISVSDVHNVSALFHRCWIFSFGRCHVWRWLDTHLSRTMEGSCFMLWIERERAFYNFTCLCVCCQHVDRFLINLRAQRVWRLLFFQSMEWGLWCVNIYLCLSRAVCNSSSSVLLRSTKMKPICFLPWVLIYCRAVYITQTPSNTLKIDHYLLSEVKYSPHFSPGLQKYIKSN